MVRATGGGQVIKEMSHVRPTAACRGDGRQELRGQRAGPAWEPTGAGEPRHQMTAAMEPWVSLQVHLAQAEVTQGGEKGGWHQPAR